MEPEASKGKRGFASMDPALRSKIAAMGGKASGGNFKNDPQRASREGRKGGEISRGGGSSPARKPTSI